MSFHATIGTSQRPAPRVNVTDRRVTSNPMQYGQDNRYQGDRAGTPAWTTPQTASYDIAAPGYQVQFASHMARSIVVRGDWRKPSKGLWTIQTQMGMVKVSKGSVTLNGEYLGQANMKRLTSQVGRNEILTAIIAGSLTKA
jgi:hypothetical protein